MGSVDVPDPPCGTEPCREALKSLGTAAERRDLIGMAKGLLMARTVCDDDTAFEILRNASMRENVKVLEIAERLVDTANAHGRPRGLRRV